MSENASPRVSRRRSTIDRVAARLRERLPGWAIGPRAEEAPLGDWRINVSPPDWKHDHPAATAWVGLDAPCRGWTSYWTIPRIDSERFGYEGRGWPERLADDLALRLQQAVFYTEKRDSG